MEPEYRKLLPVSRKCAHGFIVWDILNATTKETRVRITCMDCRTDVTKTIRLI